MITKITFRKKAPAEINAVEQNKSISATEAHKSITTTSPVTSVKRIKMASAPQLKQNKKTVTKEVVQVKKRGRPSKEEVMLREKQKLERENQLKDQIIQAQTGSLPTTNTLLSENSEILSKINIFDTPIFKFGEYVKEIIAINGRKIFKGVVMRHDIDSLFVFVSWKDGSKQWHAAKTLQKISREEYKKRDETASVTEVEVDEEFQDESENIDGIEPT